MSSIGASVASDTQRDPLRGVSVVNSRAPLHVVIGPTAAGKSTIAMQLADARGLAIVSADSRQVYTGFDIGTAKPSRQDRAQVPHYGLDFVAPTDRYSAHAWALDAERWMAKADAAQTPPLVVGGTGFYIRALASPLDPMPSLQATRRRELEQWLATLDSIEVERWCRRLDPARAHLGRTQHQRAIETSLLAGVRLSDAHRASEDEAAATPGQTVTTVHRAVHYLVVDPGPTLAERIHARVHTMVDAGWFDEVARLMRAIPPEAPAWNASGYGTIRAGLEGTMTRDAVIERVIIETRQYAKRQRTWCRHQLRDGTVTQLNPNAPDALTRALAWWDASSPEAA